MFIDEADSLADVTDDAFGSEYLTKYISEMQQALTRF